jgi:CRP-like cAMP-binding protein
MLDADWFLRLPIACTAQFAPDALITEQDGALKIHVVLSGVVRQSLVARDGRERVVAYLPRGSIFGEQQAFAAQPTASTSFTFADTACVIGYIEPDLFIARLQAEPDLLRHLLRITHNKKRQLMEELGRAVFHSARSQIAALLVVLARDPADARVIHVSQERLARLSGRTRVTVAAQLRSLASAGAIHLERSRIIVLDEDLLASLDDEALSAGVD